MKKLLVVLLALAFVFAMASVTLAVVTSSVDGKVEWTLDNANQFGGSVDGKIVFDLGKDFGEGYSAGLTIKLDPNGDTGATPPVPEYEEAAYSDGWIKMVKDFGTFTFQTGGLGGNAANDLGGQYDMTGAAGVKFESTSLVEGLSLTVVVNDTFKLAPDPVNDGNYANYLLKGVYAADPLTIGVGYQAHTIPVGAVADASTENDMMAVWAGYKLSDALSFGLEYASRPNVDGLDDSGVVKGSTAILVKADYTADPLTVNGKVQIQTGDYQMIGDGDVGTISAYNYFKNGVAGTCIKIDASYKLGEAITATASLEDIMSGATIGATNVDLTDKQLMSYKLGISDAMSEKLTVSGYYAGYGDVSEIEALASYTFVAGLVGSLEVKSNSVANSGTDAVNTYTAKLTATL